jgi:hypothetical protein
MREGVVADRMTLGHDSADDPGVFAACWTVTKNVARTPSRDSRSSSFGVSTSLRPSSKVSDRVRLAAPYP